MFCIPSSDWNGDVVFWGHGYVDVTQPLGFYNLSAADLEIPQIVQQVGFAFATTSYRQNGLAILEGVQDVQELVIAYRNLPAVQARGVGHSYMLGGSEGGLITTLLIEQHPELFNGGVAACGPIGDFLAQLKYIGDFRVLFDYFFPNVIPGDPSNIPAEVMTNWFSKYVPKIRADVAANPGNAAQLIKVSRAPTDPADPSTVETTIEHVLWYSAFSTNDAAQKLGGNAYSNRGVVYSGSNDDARLNANVQRFTADPRALATVRRYQTSGVLLRPLVTLHTTEDPIIPIWHEPLYANKVAATGTKANLTQFSVSRYGHCNVNAGEALFSFGVLLFQTLGSQPAALSRRSDVQRARAAVTRQGP